MHSLVLVDMNLPLGAIIPAFGRFLQYKVSIKSSSTNTDEAEKEVEEEPFPCSFLLPITERNRKDALYNRIITFFKSYSVGFLEEELPLAKKLINLLRDIFRYLDGHHHVFERVQNPISPVFSSFVGFNVPELSKHRKRLTRNMSADQLQDFAICLSLLLNEHYWDRARWMDIKPHFDNLSRSLASYSEYLVHKNKKTKENHRSCTPVRELSEHLQLKVLPPSSTPTSLPASLQPIDGLIANLPISTYTPINDQLPSDALKKHRIMTLLTSTGLSFPSMLLTYSAGGSIGNLSFMWQLPAQEENDPTVYFEQSQAQVEEIKKILPQIHTRAMRKAMFRKFGLISSGIKPSTLRYFYRELTGDSAASSTTDESIIDQRVRDIIDMEDPDIIADLRYHNGSHSSRFDVFWDNCQQYLNQELESAVDDRRHGQMTHLARAISVRDFISQVKSLCPEGTPIPSEEWLRLQFWPKTPTAKVSFQYTGRFKLKYMVQQRQWRFDHPDAHYAAACFRYIREYALLLREECALFSLDDKHKIKIGEPGLPVAAVERGKRVLVREDEFLTVGDHDLIHSVLVHTFCHIYG